MATLYELRDDVLNLAQRFARVDDERLSEGQVFLWIKGYRNRLIAKYTDYGKIDTEHYSQDFGVCPLTTIDTSDSAYKEWGTTIKKYILPPLVALPERRYITYLGSIDKGLQPTGTQIPLYPPNNFGGAGSIAMIAHLPMATIIGNTIYIRNYDGDYINIRPILADPTQARTYSNSTTWVPFDPVTDTYPIGEDMGREIVQLIMQNEFRMGMASPLDPANDGRSQS